MTAEPAATTAQRHLRFALGAFLLLVLYDGALRKWALPDLERLVFIAKDLLLAAALVYAIALFKSQVRFTMRPGVAVVLLVYAVWVVLQAANLNLPSLALGVWGVKAHLLYAALLVLLPLAFADLKSLYRWLAGVYPWLVVPVCVLAMAQLAAPADSFINQQVRGGLDRISYFGDAGLVRVSGTFSYITGMAVFVQSAVILGFGLALGGARRGAFLAGFGAALAVMPSTGSRSVILIAAVSVLLMLWFAISARLVTRAVGLRLVVVILLLGVASLFLQDAGWRALHERTLSVVQQTNDLERLVTTFTNAFGFFDVAGLFGFGSGATSYGAVALVPGTAPFAWLPAGIYFEEESGRIVLELGALGWAISLALRFALLLWAIDLALGGATREVRFAAVLALPVMALGVYKGTGVFAPPVGAVFYWFCVAMLMMAEREQLSLARRLAPDGPRAIAGRR
ncbi:MAG: hypothetical protein QNJ91_05980 [Gammaproteobacteria bacterium]|nr:hypothetical protein [Gammaproteobacteria bacterium]